MALQEYKALFRNGQRISGIYQGGNLVWPAKMEAGPDYTEPFYVENITNANKTLSIKKAASAAATLTIEYSTDRTIWQSLGTTSTTALTRTLAPGDKIYLRCNTNAWSSSSSNYNSITGIPKIGGNIMSLLYGNNFTGNEKSFPNATVNYVFRRLFYYDNVLSDTSCLLLPATTLNSYCYDSMFNNCTSLTTTPELPATTLKAYCYQNMFEGCTSLRTTPELPATTLNTKCYYQMFHNCKLLRTAPELPATTLINNCYSGMFYGCTALRTAPELPATTLVNNCYVRMFQGCTSLNTVKCLATNISASGATTNWLYSVATSGTFTKATGVNWPSDANGIPSGWTVQEV